MTEEFHRGPGRPRKETSFEEVSAPSIRETPEFRNELAKMMAEFEAGIMAKIVAARQDTAPSGAMEVLGQLAAEIAKMNDQGNTRKHVDPSVMAMREAAHERMNDAIRSARATNDAHKERTGKPDPGRPLYQARGKMFFSDRFIEPFTMNPRTRAPEATKLRWLGVPNQLMYPLNESAKAIHGQFMKSIGSVLTEEKASVALWVTANGLVIEAGSRGGMERTRHGLEREEFDREEIEIEDAQLGPGEWSPNRPTMNILGTVAEPASHHIGKSPRRAAVG